MVAQKKKKNLFTSRSLHGSSYSDETKSEEANVFSSPLWTLQELFEIDTSAKDGLQVTLEDHGSERLVLLHGLPLLIKRSWKVSFPNKYVLSSEENNLCCTWISCLAVSWLNALWCRVTMATVGSFSSLVTVTAGGEVE